MKKIIIFVCMLAILSSCTTQTVETDVVERVSILPHVELVTGVMAVVEGESFRTS